MNQPSKCDAWRMSIINSVSLECDRVTTLLILLDKMIPEANEIDPICSYFLRMCRQGLVETEKAKLNIANRH
jgi:hypothetical protein